MTSETKPTPTGALPQCVKPRGEASKALLDLSKMSLQLAGAVVTWIIINLPFAPGPDCADRLSWRCMSRAWMLDANHRDIGCLRLGSIVLLAGSVLLGVAISIPLSERFVRRTWASAQVALLALGMLVVTVLKPTSAGVPPVVGTGSTPESAPLASTEIDSLTASSGQSGNPIEARDSFAWIDSSADIASRLDEMNRHQEDIAEAARDLADAGVTFEHAVEDLRAHASAIQRFARRLDTNLEDAKRNTFAICRRFSPVPNDPACSGGPDGPTPAP